MLVVCQVVAEAGLEEMIPLEMTKMLGVLAEMAQLGFLVGR